MRRNPRDVPAQTPQHERIAMNRAAGAFLEIDTFEQPAPRPVAPPMNHRVPVLTEQHRDAVIAMAPRLGVPGIAAFDPPRADVRRLQHRGQPGSHPGNQALLTSAAARGVAIRQFEDEPQGPQLMPMEHPVSSYLDQMRPAPPQRQVAQLPNLGVSLAPEPQYEEETEDASPFYYEIEGMEIFQAIGPQVAAILVDKALQQPNPIAILADAKQAVESRIADSARMGSPTDIRNAYVSAARLALLFVALVDAWTERDGDPNWQIIP